MSEVLLFHHALGLTTGVVAFADTLRAAGHMVHAPDLYDGETFTALDDGLACARRIGFDVVQERGVAIAQRLPAELVYAGMSLGVMPAQRLVQTRPGARGALMLHSAVPLEEFGGEWPAGVPLQIHTMEADDWGDLDVAQELVAAVPGAELFTYPGDRHLFTDSSCRDYDEAAAALVTARVLALLDRIV